MLGGSIGRALRIGVRAVLAHPVLRWEVPEGIAKFREHTYVHAPNRFAVVSNVVLPVRHDRVPAGAAAHLVHR